MNVLAADIGGTHARFALIRVDAAGMKTVAGESYHSSRFAGPTDAATRFVETLGVDRLDAACFAVAGPVADGEARLTNLGWVLRAEDVSSRLDVQDVTLLNDFEALAYALPLLDEEDLQVIRKGRADGDGPRVVLGAGTGLGQALALPDDGRGGVRAFATEGGHVSFAPKSEKGWALRRFLAERHGHVSWERILSGGGLEAIYDFLVETGRASENGETRAAMVRGDPAAVITRRADADETCMHVLTLFLEAYGMCAADAALSTGATGGVYIGGGIAPRLRNRFRNGTFVEAFLDQGRMRRWLEDIPVRMIVRPDAALRGAVVGCPSVRGRDGSVKGPGAS